MSEAPDSEEFMSRVEALLRADQLQISPLAAGILVAVDMGIADTRSFARLLGIEHALVLREVAELSGPNGPITVTARQAKTLRTSLALTAMGARLIRRTRSLSPDSRTESQIPSDC